MPTRFVRGRYTYGFYRTIGVTECIAASQEEYVDIAIRLGTDSDYRKETESRIAEASDVLFDNRAAVRDFERILLGMIAEARSSV